MESSEPLRAEQRVNQVREQQQRRDAGDDVIHRYLGYSRSQAFTNSQQAAKAAVPIAM
jgi:hypothetical protein